MNELIAKLSERKEIDEKIIELKNSGRDQAIADAKMLIKCFDISAEDIGFNVITKKTLMKSLDQKKSSGTVAPKYLDPDTGKTWTGRGKTPLWIADKNRDNYLIK